MNKEYKPRKSDSTHTTRSTRTNGNSPERTKRSLAKDDRPFRKTAASSNKGKQSLKSEEHHEPKGFGDRSAKLANPDRKKNGKSSRIGSKPFDRKIAGSSSVSERSAVKRSVGKKSDKETVRLNKYIANAGICSRREADKLIEAGSVKVNGEVVTQMGFQVKPGDVVSYGGETLSAEAKRYFLMNKPKGYITTVDDPQERKTVMMLIDGACRERIYPVGRLDRNTTGLLLFTNDGELARKLTHPSTMVYKVYQVELNKAVSRDDMKRMLEGIELDDGEIKVDDVQYAEGYSDKRVVGVALHSGRNRIVRRIFEHLGYEVHKLDRVIFAGLTKKDLPRGRYRELTEKEVGFLKMI